jgi:hypothetical protein
MAITLPSRSSILDTCEKQGVQIANDRAYVRKWVIRERELEL